MCFVAAFIKEYSLFYADMTCLGKKVETRVRPTLQTGGGKHSFDIMRTFYGLDAVEADAERIYTCLYEILVGYPCKKTGSYPHYPQGYPLLGLNRQFFMLITGVTQFEI